MKLIFFILSCYFVYLEALKCEIGQKNGDKIKQALSMCVKNNETLEKIWEMSVGSPSSSEEHSSEEDNVEEIPTNTKSSKIKRAIMRDSSATTEGNDNLTSGKDSTNMTEESSSTLTDPSDNCIIHCVLNQMGLVDGNGLPDHSKLVDGLLKGVDGRELRNFLQDTVDECYQEVNKEDNIEPCTYSSKLVKCLADKGRSNCADWPAGSLPF